MKVGQRWDIIVLILIVAIVAFLAGYFVGKSQASQPIGIIVPKPYQVTSHGGLASAVGHGTPGAGSSTGPCPLTVTLNGLAVTGVLPKNQFIPANGLVAVVTAITPLSPILTNLTIGPATGAGEVFVDNNDMNAKLTATGQFPTGFALLLPIRSTPYAVSFNGPFTIGNAFTISSALIFSVTVDSNCNASVPVLIAYTLPSPGDPWSAFTVTATYNQDFKNMPARMTIFQNNATGTPVQFQFSGTLSNNAALSFANLTGPLPLATASVVSLEIDVPQQSLRQPRVNKR